MRALVLGGGGITGVGWEIGLLAGLAEAGMDLSIADPPELVVGTSAGSVVGAQVASGVDLQEAYARQLEDPRHEIGARLTLGTLLRFGWAALMAPDPARFAARVGRMALAAPTVSEADRLAVIASRLPVKRWPERRLLLSAVDALTGEVKIFDRDSGATIVEAVAASCAVPGVWPPVTIGGRRYIDGGIRSGTHLDLAQGYGAAIALVPLPRSFGPITSAAAHARQLERQGSQVLVISPDAAALQAIGRNVLDPRRRAPAAQAGRSQAQAVADQVRSLWRAGA
jgi:NTE family protein